MLKRIIVVAVIVVGLVAGGIWYYSGIITWKNDGKLEVSGTLTKHYQWFDLPGSNLWVFITEPGGLPCASTITDINGTYAFEFTIDEECDFSGVDVTEGTWKVWVPIYEETREVELADNLQPILDFTL